MGNWPDFGSGFPGWTPFGPLSTTETSIPTMAPGCKALRDKVNGVWVDPAVVAAQGISLGRWEYQTHKDTTGLALSTAV